MDIKIGCDPELFVTQEGKFRSAWGLIPGTKETPYPVKDGAVQVDGMALEFNIDPVQTSDDFVSKINSVMSQMRDMVPDKYQFAIVPSCRFNGNHFRVQPDEAKELGCTPDFNAYTLKENNKPDNKTTMRTASGHIHIGFIPDGETVDPNSDEHMIRCATLVKQLDVYLGFTSLFYDKDKSRRTMYGSAGAFRPKPYGLEYRVLSNAWLASEDRMRFVFDQTVMAVNELIAGNRAVDKVGERGTQTTLNYSDTYSAQTSVSRFIPNGTAVLNRAISLA